VIIFLAPLLRRGGSTARVDTTNAHRAAAPARTTFVAGALGYTLNLLFLLIERRLVHWAGR
jgi:hypothetical protein